LSYGYSRVAAVLEDPFALVGTTLDGQYRADQVVGEGGYGVVYRGWHVSLEQPIAIKALKVMSAEDRAVQDALFAKFKDEAKLLYTLSQESLNIVRSMDFGAVTTASGAWAPYMVLEWLQGRSLADDLAQRRRARMGGRSLDEALALLEPAAEGLTIAHQRRVAHRDIKPANFFLLDSAPGAAPRVKVLDFGIAKIIRDGEGPGTRSPFASFTWLYAAPEQLDPRVGQSGLATDVYSFALLLSELLTDRVPTEGRDVVSLLRAATDPTVRPTPRQRGANVPDGIEVACRRALAVDPKVRFATIAELWTALSAARRPTLPPSVGAASNVPTTKPSAGGPPPGNPPSPSAQPPMSPPMSPPAASPPPALPSPPAYGQPGPSAVYPPGAYPPGSGPPQYPQGPPVATYPSTHGQPSPFASRPHGSMMSPPPMSPPPMSPPPGTAMYPQRRFIPQGPSALPIVLAVIGVLVGVLFFGTCAALHAAC
jgi:serine/threonine protein kinase